MAIFNVNQNRQFYVVSKCNEMGATTAPAALGDMTPNQTKDMKQIWFKHMGKGGLTRTDIIDVDKITDVKVTTHEAMKRYPKKAEVKLSPDVNGGNPISGQDYILRLQVNNFLAPGDACVYIKSNAVHATKAMEADKTLFYTALKESLERNFDREYKTAGMKLFTFDASEGDKVTITEVVDQPWRLGILSQEPVNFEVVATTVKYDGEDVIWAELNDKGVIPVEVDKTGTPVENGKQVADLEYFCMAERGDVFRNMGWPYNIDVQYMVEPDKKYTLVDVHYSYSGDGVQVHKSEKDITFAIESANDTAALTPLKKIFTDLDITVNEAPVAE